MADAEPDALWRRVDELLNGLLCPPDEGLAGAVRDGASPFDLVFLDADEPNGPAYLSWALPAPA